MQYPLAYVRWSDSCRGMEDCLAEEIESHAELHTVGFVIRHNAAEVVLARDYYGQRVRDYVAIPAVNVLEMIQLRKVTEPLELVTDV